MFEEIIKSAADSIERSADAIGTVINDIQYTPSSETQIGRQLSER